MALPFILGLAVGAGAVIAFSNKDKIKEKTTKLIEKTKENVDEMKKKHLPRKEKSDNLDSMELKDKEEEWKK